METDTEKESRDIPADLRRRVLVEAGHRCSIPTCREIYVDIHHIEPWAKTRKHEYHNLICLCANCHRMAHDGKIDRKSQYLYKANVRYVHDKFSQLEVDILLSLSRELPGFEIAFPVFNLILINRIIAAGLLTLRQPSGGTMQFGMDTSPRFLSLSAAGKKFLEEISAHEL
ncbi:HNH endonuclease signature motif containing protein [Neorhizobium alkalisoli]|uniref:HNH endonuclease signature motif containing protein n=1 Tax=Neorhizobium alkalisoli TaxID=528178 RepID=UPI0011A081ED|nr:HNH endonuclease signature motif containing protein [Neorhizobium alkalisoli]